MQSRCVGYRSPHVGLVLLATMLSGCVVGPDYAPPLIALPTHWGTKQPKEVQPPQLTQWWRRFKDPLLNGLIADAVAANLDVATAKAKIREARATRRVATGALFPELTGSAAYTRYKNAMSQATGLSDSEISGPFNQFQFGLDASWELDLFGANRRNVEAATRGLEAAEEELRSTLLTLVGDVASYYIQARGYQLRIALARRTGASQRNTATLTRNKFQAGSASGVDVARAAAQASTTAANIPAYQVSYAEAVHRLGVLLGREPALLMQTLGRGPASMPAPPPRLPTGMPAEILCNRPDVRKAERQLAQATANIGQAEAALYPSVSLTGSIATSGTRIGDLFKSSSISWSYGPSVSIPIFKGGALRAQVNVAEAQRDQYYLALRSAVLSALEDVENAIVSSVQHRVQAQRLTDAVQNYRQAADLSRSLYESGASSFLDVLDAERSLYSAEDSLLQTRVSVALDYVALAKALGGGWDGHIDSSMPEVIDVNTGPHLAPRH